MTSDIKSQFAEKQKTENLLLIAKTLSSAMNQSVAVRKLIYSEANKQFDFQPDVLYEAIKDKPIEGTTVKEYLKQYANSIAPGKNFETAIYSLHYLQFSVPVHLDRWNPDKPIPVAVLPADWDEATLQYLQAYNPDGSVLQLSAKETPNFPVLVVSEAERIDANGNLCVDQRGIVLSPEARIHYTKAIALAEKRSTLKSAVKTEPFVIVLPDDSFARMKARIEHESFMKHEEEQKLLTLFENYSQKHLKSTLNNNIKKICLRGFSNFPNTINLEWDNPTGLTLRFYIYVTGYFNINGVKTLVEKRLIKTSDNLKDAIILDYAFEYYNIWIEGRYYQNSLQAVSNYLVVQTSARKSSSKEYVNHFYISESKIREVEGWYANDLEFKANYTLAKTKDEATINEIGKEMSTKGKWSIYGWHVIDTERDYSPESFPLFTWDRMLVDVTSDYTTFDNGVYNIQWREYDATIINSSASLNIAASVVKSVLTSVGVDPTVSEIIVDIGKMAYKVYIGDEDLGEYRVTWWTKPNTQFPSTTGFAVWHSFN